MSFPLAAGTCNCGAVRFEITAAVPQLQLLPLHPLPAPHGAGASPNARVADGAFRIVRGEDQIRSWKPPEGALRSSSAATAARPCSHAIRRAGSACASSVLDGDPGIWPSRDISSPPTPRPWGTDPRRWAPAPPRSGAGRRRA